MVFAQVEDLGGPALGVVEGCAQEMDRSFGGGQSSAGPWLPETTDLSAGPETAAEQREAVDTAIRLLPEGSVVSMPVGTGGIDDERERLRLVSSPSGRSSEAEGKGRTGHAGGSTHG
ncbi:hypothetical protein AB0K12_37855 [Nonomuraea sp. NPDC049419]|uniref:hypothetical protein n=1 Tax=Nonomuraea sp. NPDC049419 TaxID=3155772 RepID=UPI00343F4A0C